MMQVVLAPLKEDPPRSVSAKADRNTVMGEAGGSGTISAGERRWSRWGFDHTRHFIQNLW